MKTLVPLGDRAFLARFDDEEAAARWASAVRSALGNASVEVVLAYQTVGVHADPSRIDLDALEDRLARLEPDPLAPSVGKLVTIPVLYEGEDLPDVADRLDASVAEVVQTHSGPDYRVFAIGFQPGFPYAGYLPPRLSGLARRTPPRTRVPAGSVAIAGRQTAIYPSASPGGWHLIGRTPLRIVDVEAGRFPIAAGDRLRFVPIDRNQFDARRGEMLTP